MLLRRIVTILVVLPVSVGLVMLAVANRQDVGLIVDPLGGEGAVELPLFLVVFGALIVGVVLGGASVWLGQSRWRRAARRSEREARRAKAQAEELKAALAVRTGTGPARAAAPALASSPATPALVAPVPVDRSRAA